MYKKYRYIQGLLCAPDLACRISDFKINEVAIEYNRIFEIS